MYVEINDSQELLTFENQYGRLIFQHRLFCMT